MATVKYTIEQENELWYTKADLSETSDVPILAWLFTKEEAVSILKSEAVVYRIEKMCVENETVLDNIVQAVHDKAWGKHESWDDFSNRIKESVVKNCRDVVEDAISRAKIEWDIEDVCAEEVIRRCAKE